MQGQNESNKVYEDTYKFKVDVENKTIYYNDMKFTTFILLSSHQDMYDKLFSKNLTRPTKQGAYSYASANILFTQKYGITPSNFIKVFNGKMMGLWVNPIKDLVTKYAYNFKKLDVHKVQRLHDHLDMVRKAPDIAPFVVAGKIDLLVDDPSLLEFSTYRNNILLTAFTMSQNMWVYQNRPNFREYCEERNEVPLKNLRQYNQQYSNNTYRATKNREKARSIIEEYREFNSSIRGTIFSSDHRLWEQEGLNVLATLILSDFWTNSHITVSAIGEDTTRLNTAITFYNMDRIENRSGNVILEEKDGVIHFTFENNIGIITSSLEADTFYERMDVGELLVHTLRRGEKATVKPSVKNEEKNL